MACFLPSGLTRGLQYTVWSYAPQPKPVQLNRSRPVYPAVLTRSNGLLDVWPGVTAPPFGSVQRTRQLTALLDDHPEIARYIPLEKAALTVAGNAQSPYAAAISLESWFRSRGGFTYSNNPAVFSEAPLVGFVVQTRDGYCQYFAGAMALMLRYLGVPARVAVGFSSGTYNAHSGVWTVTDHEAHAWVEAWFARLRLAAVRPDTGCRAARARAARRAVLGGLAELHAAGDRDHRRRRPDRAGAVGAPPRRGRRAEEQGSREHGRVAVRRAPPEPARAAGAAAGRGARRDRARRSWWCAAPRYASRDPRRLAAACRQELADFLLDQQIDAARSATLHELGALVREELAVDPDRFVAAATAARFGPPAGARPAARDARRELRALIRAVRHRLTTRERLRGLVSLRSLGFAS